MNNVKIPFDFIFLRAHVCNSRTHKGARMRIAVIGQSLFGQEVYKELRKDGHTIVGVFTIPDKDGKADPLGKNSQRQHHFNGNINGNTACLLSPKQCWKWLSKQAFFCTSARNKLMMVSNDTGHWFYLCSSVIKLALLIAVCCVFFISESIKWMHFHIRAVKYL